MSSSIESVLITVPVSSPLHPQAALPYLKGFLTQHGFRTKIIDSNIRFFRWLLEEYNISIDYQEYIGNPVSLLKTYNKIEQLLSEKTAQYKNLTIDLRTIGMHHNRNIFAEVLLAVKDQASNPFIEFYNSLIESDLQPLSPDLIGIGITFQDQIIAAFTLADCLRKKMPHTKIVLGGQMITRCYDTMLSNDILNHLWDYLVCWDGELPLLDLHENLFRDNPQALTNVISKKEKTTVDQNLHAFDLSLLDSPDFTDFDFSDYLFPEFLIPLQTARGCYGSCEFCAIPSGSNTNYRERHVDKIIADIVDVQRHTEETYGKKATYFKLMDDTSSPKTLKRLAEQICQQNIDVKWETFVRMEKPFENAALMKQLYAGGCRKLMWGLETNDPEILNKMDKRISPVSTSKVLDAAHEAGILNFVFVLIGFPGENQSQRDGLAKFIIEKDSIHTLTIATFDVTKRSIIQKRLMGDDCLGLCCEQPTDFEVRLPYTVNGNNWKKEIVTQAQRFLTQVVDKRPDIGFMTLFPDQVRGILSDQHGNTWGKKFLSEFGEENIKALLLATQKYIHAFENDEEIDLSGLPEPIKREHHRTLEDIEAIARAANRRKKYDHRRVDSI